MISTLPSFHRDGVTPGPGWIFVFGSNLAGRHGAGAAKVARDSYGAKYGVGIGATGSSYAIPTKDGRSGGSLARPQEVLPLATVREHIERFVRHAQEHRGEWFFVTRVGCGRAGFTDEDIAPAFAHVPINCSLPMEWKRHIVGLRAATA